MIKKLKFSEPLPELILNGTKTATWRIDDEKGITKGDRLSLCRKDGKEFARALVISTKNTTFGKLTEQDKEGHEKFDSDSKMYATLSAYYNAPITEKTQFKIVRFQLI